MPHRARATSIHQSLETALPPIGVTLSDAIPDGVESFQGRVAAGCVFWERAAQGVFATSGPDHELCAIGVHTHNLVGTSDDYRTELGAVLGVLDQMTYLRADEVASVPQAAKASKHAIYGPAAELPFAPDVVLVFADSRRGLVVAEAVQQVERGAPPALGRPACAIVPQVINTGRAAVSLGCCGARAYLDRFDDGVALWGLPGAKLAAYAERIEALTGANNTLTDFHRLRAQDVAAGKRPTYADSLVRLQAGEHTAD